MRSSSAELSSSALVFQMQSVGERSGADGEVLMQTGDGSCETNDEFTVVERVK
jgi:hypothetical protein